MKKRVRAYMRNGRNRRFWKRLLSVLSCVVVFVTTYALLLPAVTLEKTAACGMEAHQHDQSCFEQHLICGLEETDGHQHTDDCYTVNRVLACTIEEHSHTEECFNEEGELTCALAEHSHDDGCWREDRVLSCKKEETEPHHHTDTCYESVLVCQKPVHIHSPECYVERSLNLAQYLTGDTTIYVRAAGDESEGGLNEGWLRVDDTAEITASDLVRLHYAYTIPAGTLTGDNRTIRYALPDNVRLTDGQIREVNAMNGGRGAQAVEGTRTPDQEQTGNEYVSAWILFENVYDKTDKKHKDPIGQNLILTFDDAALEKNRKVFGQDGALVDPGEEINGFFSIDVNTDQISFDRGGDSDGEKETDVTLVEENKDLGISPIRRTIRVIEAEEEQAEAVPEILNEEAWVEEEFAAAEDEAVVEESAVSEDGAVTEENAAAEEDAVIEEDSDTEENAASVEDSMEEEEPAEEAVNGAEAPAEVLAKEGQEDLNQEEQDQEGKSSGEQAADSDKENEEETKEKGRTTIYQGVADTLTYEGADYTVTASYTEDAGIPDGASLVVSEITEDDDSQAYQNYRGQAEEAVAQEPGRKVSWIRLFDITIEKNGKPIEPQAPVSVQITYHEAIEQAADTTVDTVHFEGKKETPKVLETAAEGTDTATEQVSFETDGFSVFAVVGTTMEMTVLASDGHNYKVTVTYGAETGIPNDADLEVKELVGAQYIEYLTKTAQALNAEKEQLTYARFFDISIFSDGKRIQPVEGTSVDVKIELADKPEQDHDISTKIVHFGDTPEIVDAAISEGEIRFDAAGFSVYAITDVDGTVLIPRAIYEFYDENGNRLQGIQSQIIKNLEALTPVSAPEQSNKAFLGWYIYDSQNHAWGEQVVFNTPITVLLGNEKAVYGNSVVVPKPAEGVSDPDHVNVEVRARYTDRFATVYFLTDDVRNGFNVNLPAVVQDSRKIGIPENENMITYILPDKDEMYTKSGNSSYTFVGWSTERPYSTGSGSNISYDYYTQNDHRQTISELPVTRGQTYRLYPVFKRAHWLNFKTAPAGAGATYISPAYVENNQSAAGMKPEDPVWRGYKFRYWTETPTFDPDTGAVYQFEEGNEPPEYNFDQSLSDDVNLYAYWESGYTTYTVIHWKQKASDNKEWNNGTDNADKRTYEFEEQEQFEVKVGTVITADKISVKDDYKGFHHRTDDNKDTVSVTVDSSGSAVFNVYYDRDTVSMKFYKGNGSGPTGGYDSDVWNGTDDGYKPAADDEGTQYALVDGQYVQLTRQTTGTTTEYYLSRYNNNGAEEYTGTIYDVDGKEITDPVYGDKYYRYRGYTWGEYYGYGDLYWLSRAVPAYTWYLNGQEYTGPRYIYDPDSNYFVYTGLYGQTLEQNHYQWPEGTWSYYNDDNGTTGMSYLGQFVLPDGVRDPNGREIRLYSTSSTQTRIEFFLQKTDGTYDTAPADTGYVERGGTFYFSEKYDGFLVAQYRRYTQSGSGTKTYYNSNNTSVSNGNNAWANANVGGSVSLSYRTRYYHLEIRYARTQYDILFYDPVDNTPITVQMKDGTTAQSKSGVYYEAPITDYYPDSEFEVASTHIGYSFNGRWYADQGQSIQVFFHDKQYNDSGDEDSPALTEAEQIGLWYYTDTSGEKIYTNYVPTAEQLEMTLETGGRQYAQDQYVIYTEMPMHDLPVYAGFSKNWYWIKIDPDGGELNPNGDFATYFWLEYGDKVQEYPITRNYLEDPSGTYYYHYAEFNETDPDGPQPSPRKAFYSENETDQNLPGSTKHFRPAEENEGYDFIGWYEVLEDGSLTPYNFDTEVTHNLILKAVWREKGNFRVYYSTDKALDVNGNELTDITVGTAPGFVHDGDFLYSEDANIVVQNKSVEPQGEDAAEYEFVGWYFNNRILNPGDIFSANPILAEMYPGETEGTPNTFILYPVFNKRTQEIPHTINTALILDMNGGKTSLSTPAGENPDYLVNTEKTQISYSEEKINAAIDLPENTGEAVFTKDKCEFLGWAFSKDAKSPVFIDGQRIGIDNLSGSGYHGEGVNILYAVWRMEEVPVRIIKVDHDRKNIKLGGGTFTLESVDGTLTSQQTTGYLANEENVTVFSLATPAASGAVNTYSLKETNAPDCYQKWEEAVSIKVAYDGTVSYVQQDENNGEEQEADTDADGNSTIVVTNKLSAIPLKVVKIDQEGRPLEGASFCFVDRDFEGNDVSGLETSTIYESTKKEAEDDAEAVIVENEAVPIGTYTLRETKAPDGYNALDGDVEIILGRGDNDITLSVKVGGEELPPRYIERDLQTGQRTIKIMNTAGVELPSTGGPGTTLIYLLGTILMALAATGLVMRKKRRA